MNRDDIIRMAREAGLPYMYQTGEIANLGLVERFAHLVYESVFRDANIAASRTILDAAVLEEREACAAICDSYSEFRWSWWKTRADPLDQGAADAADELAQRIRSRK